MAQAVADPAHDRLYVSFSDGGYIDDGPTLNVFDTSQARRLMTLEDPELSVLALNRSGTRLVSITDYFGERGHLRFYDTATMTLVADVPLPCAPSTVTCSVSDMAYGPDDRLYWISYSDTVVNIFDPATGTSLGYFEAADGAAIARIAIAGDQLFVFEETNNNWTPHIRRYNIAATAPVAELSVPTHDGVYFGAVSPDGAYFFAASDNILYLYDGQTLQPAHTLLETSKFGFGIMGTTFSPDGRRAIVLAENPYNDLHSQLLTFDPATGAVINVGHLKHEKFATLTESRLAPLADGEIAVVLRESIEIFRPTSHAAAVPVTFNNTCSGGFIRDFFTDPTSGWPSGDNGNVAFGYDSETYMIRQRNADAWFAVGRGDRWVDGQRTAISTRVVDAEGLSGLVFGLNDDWSHFYTLEIAPSLGRWVVFEYLAGAGWNLLATGTDGHIAAVGGWNRVEIQQSSGDHEMHLFVNDTFLYRFTMPNVDGRIAISAGSFAPNFEARFDNYYFSGQNCPWNPPNRATGLEFSPPIARPPLEEFLP